MKPERIAELRALCDKATSDPWKITGPKTVEVSCGMAQTSITILDLNPHDANLALVARTALPEALDEIERLRSVINDMCIAATGKPASFAESEE